MTIQEIQIALKLVGDKKYFNIVIPFIINRVEFTDWKNVKSIYFHKQNTFLGEDIYDFTITTNEYKVPFFFAYMLTNNSIRDDGKIVKKITI